MRRQYVQTSCRPPFCCRCTGAGCDLSNTGLCAGCADGQACPLFSSAVPAARSLLYTCKVNPAEKVVRLNAHIVTFEDPPHVKGDGPSSGGPHGNRPAPPGVGTSMGRAQLRGVNQLGQAGAVSVAPLVRATEVRRLRWLAVATCSALVTVGALATSSPPALASPLPSIGTSFDPESVTFVSLDMGWVLGTAPCAPGATCLALRETTDAARSWSSRPLPSALVAAADRKVDGAPADLWGGSEFGLNVRFADPTDGWIYGGLEVPGSVGPTLWSTHDGGVTWREQPTARLTWSIFDLETAAGRVYMMAERTEWGGVTLESSPVARDHWHAGLSLGNNAGGAEPSGTIVLQGRGGWLVEGNDRGTAGSARLDSAGQWAPWTPPCASVGNSFAAPAASGATDLVAVCVMGGFASGLSKAAPRGAVVGSSWLYFSDNGGTTFTAGPELGPQGYSFGVVPTSEQRRLFRPGDCSDLSVDLGLPSRDSPGAGRNNPRTESWCFTHQLE